jgi:hypothetical protein
VAASVWTVMPLPLSTTSKLPEESIIIPRGVRKFPAIFVARHPDARVDEYLAAETPLHDAGIGVDDCLGTTAD